MITNKEVLFLRRRLAALEDIVGRLKILATSTNEAFIRTGELDKQCGRCNKDPTGRTVCTIKDCPQGLPLAKSKTKSRTKTEKKI